LQRVVGNRMSNQQPEQRNERNHFYLPTRFDSSRASSNRLAARRRTIIF
jgi:hypothetical protein